MYHPDFFDVDSKGSVRKCLDRFVLIKPFVEKGSKLLDIGCSEGYFSFSFAYHCGLVVGIDNSQELIDENNKVAVQHGVPNISFFVDDVGTLFKNPQGEKHHTILYMSCHHHVIQKYGFEEASALIENISKSGEQMFFDMGQKDEGCVGYKWWEALPEVASCEDWVHNYLLMNTVYKNVDCIGSSKVHGVPRYLFRCY